MESDLQQHHHQQEQMNSGLMRYRSAPSSYFSSFLDREISEEFLHPRPSSPETDQILARFISGNTENNNFRENSPPNEAINQQTQFMEPILKSEEIVQQQQNYYPPLPNHNSNSAMDFRMVTSMEMNRFPPMKMEGGSNSNLIRQNSSPAGLFSHLNVETGYAAMRGMGNYGAGNAAKNEVSFSSASRLKMNQMSFSSGPPSSLATIPESGSKNMGASSPDDNGGFQEDRSTSNNYITGFPVGSPWDDHESEIQNVEAGNRPPRMLAHHLSLPKTSAEMNSIEKFLQFQDSVPCKIRAKRGCATHPRSIAERVRRTRISERMRKLQELVPNMDKQTNTSDMLDLAVEYIKDLQREVKTLSDSRAKCTCSDRQQL